MIDDFKIFLAIGGFLLSFWWLYLLTALFFIFWKIWIYYIQHRYWHSIEWIVLEIIPPKRVERSPKAMEQIFAGIWAIWGTVSTKVDEYIRGVIQEYMSFEITSFGGHIHFYIRLPKAHRNMVEAQIFAQYPEAEINLVNDYVENVPKKIPNKDWELWGSRFKLAKPDVYPIRTYQAFEESKPELCVDPLASLVEVLSKLKNNEQIWIQMLVKPIDDSWQKEGEKVIKEIIEKHTVPGQTGLMVRTLSPAEESTIKAINNNISKKGFEVCIRWAYLAPRKVFYKPIVGAVIGCFNQFNDLNLNGLKPSGITKANYLFTKLRADFKKRILFRELRERSFWEKGFVLNVEELATIYHFPSIVVKSLATPRIEMKKAGPPADLPVSSE